MTGFGFLGIYAYHFSVEYYPVFDIKSVASLIFAVAYTGSILILNIGMFNFAPAILIASMRKGKPASTTVEREIQQIFPYFFFAWTALLALGVAVLFEAPYTFYVVAGTVAGIFVINCAVATWKSNAMIGSLDDAVAFTMVCILQLLPLYFYVLMLDSAPNAGSVEWTDFLGGLGIIGAFIQITSAYFFIAWFSRNLKPVHRMGSIIALVIVIFIITLISDRADFLGARTANLTKFGNFYATKLALSDEGCKIINSGGERICSGGGKGSASVCGALVVSRIGAETYLRIYREPPAAKAVPDASASPPAHSDNFATSVFLPSKDILALTLYDKKGIVKPNDKGLLAGIAACKSAANVKASTLVPPKDEQYFDFDSDELTPAGRSLLAGFAGKLAELESKTWTVTVLGYADQIGPEKHNTALAKNRAAAVADFLRSVLPPELGTKVRSKGAGSGSYRRDNQVCPESMSARARKECVATNRRTEIVVHFASS